MTGAGTVRTALADRQLARLLLTWGTWVAGDWAFLIAVSVQALELGGPAAVGLVGAVRVLPAVVLSGAATGLADRIPRPRLIALLQLAWCLVGLATAALTVLGAPLGALLVPVAVGSAVWGLHRPTLQALLPQLVEGPRTLVVANAAWATIEGLGTVLGPAGCALLLTVTGPSSVFVGVAVTAAAGAVAAGTIRTPFQPSRRPAGERPGAGLLLGLRCLTRTGPSVVFGLFMAQTTMRGLLNVFVVVLATTGPGGDPARAGTLFAALGVGGLLAATLGGVGGGTAHGGGVRRFALGIALWGLPVVVIGLSGHLSGSWGVALVALAVIGFGNGLADVYGYTLLARFLPDHLAGRAWGAFVAVGATVIAVGSLLAPPLIDALGLPGAMIVTGALLTVAPLLVWRWLARVGTQAAGDPALITLFASAPLLAPLPPLAIERLARSASRVEVAAGTLVLERGEVADACYVVDAGELVVRRPGGATGSEEEVRRLGRGDAFGEIGLLRGGRRTATVGAVTTSRLVRIDGPSFVAAVTGHRATDQQAADGVRARLADDESRGGA